MERYSYLALGTLESFQKVKRYYGSDKVIPVYIEVSDEKRLDACFDETGEKQAEPNYEEVCRRFLADQRDFSEENIKNAGIRRRFAKTKTGRSAWMRLRPLFRNLSGNSSAITFPCNTKCGILNLYTKV